MGINRNRNGREFYLRYPHGHIARYSGGYCRCVVCVDAARVWRRKMRTDPPRISTARVRRHLRELRRQGVGKDAIAEVTGISPRTLSWIRSGRQRKTTRATEAKILAVGAGARCGGAPMSAKTARRRIRKLHEEGFTSSDIAQRSRVCLAVIWKIINGYPRIRAKTDANIARLYFTVIKAPLGAAAAPAPPAPRVRREERVRLTPERGRPRSSQPHPWRVDNEVGYQRWLAAKESTSCRG